MDDFMKDSPPPPYSPPHYEIPQTRHICLIILTDVLNSIQTTFVNCCVCMGLCFGA